MSLGGESIHALALENLGDLTLIADQVRAGDVPAPDILVGGTPCQAFSVAGARNGLADPRGALTLKFVEIADAIDQKRQEHNQPPAIIVWENVPGILSDNRSNAFGCLLGALAGEGCALEPAGRRWTNAGCVAGPRRRIAWRVLNAQYFGVAQRRRRVFLVASGRDDLDPAEVLFEPCGLHGDSSPDCEEGQVPAGPARSGADRSGYLADGHYRNPRITVCFGGGNTQGPIDQAACLTARGHKCDFEVETFAAQSITGQIAHDRPMSPHLSVLRSRRCLTSVQLERPLHNPRASSNLRNWWSSPWHARSFPPLIQKRLKVSRQGDHFINSRASIRLSLDLQWKHHTGCHGGRAIAAPAAGVDRTAIGLISVRLIAVCGNTEVFDVGWVQNFHAHRAISLPARLHRGDAPDRLRESGDATLHLEHKEPFGRECCRISTQLHRRRIAGEHLGQPSETLTEAALLVGDRERFRSLDVGSSSGKSCLRLPWI